MGEEYEDYRKKWDEFPSDFKQERVSIHLDLELTTYCNLSCDFCPRTQIGLKSEHMSLELAKEIIEEFASKGGCSIKLVYLGEPLLYPHLGEVIKHAKEHGIIDTIIATNGNLLTIEKAMELVKSGLDFIIFSIDSFRPFRYEALRKGGHINKVIEGVVYLNSLRNGKPKIQIQAIPIPPFNDGEISSGEYEAFWKPFADVIRVSPYLVDYDNTTEIGETPSFSCPSPFRRLTVRVNGDIALCCGSRLDSKVVGNYANMSLEEAWNSEYFKRVRSKMNEGKSHEIEACKKCVRRLHG